MRELTVPCSPSTGTSTSQVRCLSGSKSFRPTYCPRCLASHDVTLPVIKQRPLHLGFPFPVLSIYLMKDMIAPLCTGFSISSKVSVTGQDSR